MAPRAPKKIHLGLLLNDNALYPILFIAKQGNHWDSERLDFTSLSPFTMTNHSMIPNIYKVAPTYDHDTVMPNHMVLVVHIVLVTQKTILVG